MRTRGLVLVPLLMWSSCGDDAGSGNDAGVPDAGDSGTDTDPYAVPDPVIEEPPPLADCEIDWVRTYDFPEANVQSSSIRGMTQLQSGNYLAVGGALVTDVGEQGLLMEITPNGDLVNYALRGEDLGFYHHAIETDDGFMVFGQSWETGNYHCVMDLLSEGYEGLWDGGDEIYDCIDPVRKPDGAIFFAVGMSSDSALCEIGLDYGLDCSGQAYSFLIEAMTLVGEDSSAMISNNCEGDYPIFCTPHLALASGMEWTQDITYNYEYSTGFSEMVSSGDGHILISGGQNSYYGSIYLLYVTDNGFPVWSRFVGYENAPSPNGLVRDEQGYLFGGYSAEFDAYAGRIDQDGHLLWHFLYDAPGDIGVWGIFNDTNDSGNLLYGGYVDSDGQQSWVMKIKYNEVCY